MATIKSATVGFGRALLNEMENDGYNLIAPNGGDIIAAHSDSDVSIELDAPALIQGGLSSAVEPYAKHSFTVDGETVGKLGDSDMETYPKKLEAGEHRLKITSVNNANGHSYWRFTDLVDNHGDVKVFCCGKSRASVSVAKFVANVGYQTLSKNYAQLFNDEILRTDGGGNKNDVIVLCDDESDINENVLEKAISTTDKQRCVVIPKYIVSTKNVRRNNDDPNNYSGIAAVVMTRDAFIKLKGFDERIEGFSKIAQNIIKRYSRTVGSVVQEPIGFICIRKHIPNPRYGKKTGSVELMDWHVSQLESISKEDNAQVKQIQSNVEVSRNETEQEISVETQKNEQPSKPKKAVRKKTKKASE